MAKDAGWGRRLRSARRAYVEQFDRTLTYAEIGKRLGRALGRPPFKHSTVRAWFVDGQEPESYEIAKALAVVIGADAGYLMTGNNNAPATEAEALRDPEVGAVGLSPAQKARALEKDESIQRETAKTIAPAKRPRKAPKG